MEAYEQIVRQIGASLEELGRVLEEERRKFKSESQSRIDELTAELETDRKRIETLVQKLKEARQEASEAREIVRQELQERLALLEKAAEDAREELGQERSIRKRLEKGAAADERRLSELERALAEGGAAASAPCPGKEGADVQLGTLQSSLAEALAVVKSERDTREGLEAELGEAHKLIEALEKALKKSRELPRGFEREMTEESDQNLRDLAEKLASVEAQLEKERREGQRYAEAHAEAQRRIAELEQALGAGGRTAGQLGSFGGETSTTARQSTEKPLPHELRPPPKPGALFRPDWDLQGLPCKSADQILQAWGSVFNVQLSLEGYPSQYCAAFLAVIKAGKQKQLYVLFNLKGSKHRLVCVPSKLPGDEASLNKLIAAGQKYLQMSGFELEKIAPADVANALGVYFQQE